MFLDGDGAAHPFRVWAQWSGASFNVATADDQKQSPLAADTRVFSRGRIADVLDATFLRKRFSREELTSYPEQPLWSQHFGADRDIIRKSSG